MMRNNTEHPIRVRTLRLAWLKGTEELQSEDVGGPTDTILPGAEGFFTFTVDKNTQSQWTVDTLPKITCEKFEVIELNEAQGKVLKGHDAQLRKIKVDRTNLKRINYREISAVLDLDNDNETTCENVAILVLGFGADKDKKIKKIAEARLVLFDTISPKNRALDIGGTKSNNLNIYYESIFNHNYICLYADIYSYIDNYESRVVAVGKKKEEFLTPN
jgi:hypothetical protein